VAGYVRAESLAAASWARARGLPAVLMSESQSIDRPRAWWKEAIKRRRVRRFDAALVGGPAHREYLEALGMPPERIALGYNAVDNEHFASACARSRSQAGSRSGLPPAPYFLAVGRFVSEKNLERLIRAFAAYRRSASSEMAWDLVLCGGGELAARLDGWIRAEGLAGCVHRPGFLQAEELPRWYAHASAFVLPSLSEPWGLVANEAAASGLPLLVSDRAGCARTLVPDPPGRTGWRLDPTDTEHIAASLARMSACPEAERSAMGRRAAEIVAEWGPERFASGLLDAVGMAYGRRSAPRSTYVWPRAESGMTNSK
jgi:glycosyltransferase involved in cell wall biosynthesis